MLNQLFALAKMVSVNTILIATFISYCSQTAHASLITNVFINEIHYDNSGGDVDEFIELAGVAGTNLLNWSVYAYNGNDQQVYKKETISTDTFLANTANGFGFYLLAFDGLQNGGADAIALVNPDNDVIQFLSYEGIITAIDGPATGLTSVDIGVAENGQTPIGYSLQLSGTGNKPQDFSWQPAAMATKGAINHNQQFLSLPISAPIANVSEPNSIELMIIFLGLLATRMFMIKQPAYQLT